MSLYAQYLRLGELSIVVAVDDVTLQGKFNGVCGACESDDRPVCASNGQTFTTECALKTDVCVNSSNIFMLYKGRCQGITTHCNTV